MYDTSWSLDYTIVETPSLCRLFQLLLTQLRIQNLSFSTNDDEKKNNQERYLAITVLHKSDKHRDKKHPIQSDSGELNHTSKISDP